MIPVTDLSHDNENVIGVSIGMINSIIKITNASFDEEQLAGGVVEDDATKKSY